MNIPIPLPLTVPFSDEAIFYQLNRIFRHADFSRSEILKRFLFFVVNETLIGNADHLKEYTIALNVLGKPPNFNPQKNCIVRIHAGRLRLALSRYYDDPGKDNEVIIGIPKGTYVPVFMDRQQNKPPVTFAILPFVCTGDDDMLSSLADSLCLQICSSLTQITQITVLAYQAVKSLAEKYPDLKEFGNLVGFNQIITGGITYIKGIIRITIQIIECRSYRQLWSEVFECRATSNLFDIQDQICRRTVREITLLATNTPVCI